MGGVGSSCTGTGLIIYMTAELEDEYMLSVETEEYEIKIGETLYIQVSTYNDAGQRLS